MMKKTVHLIFLCLLFLLGFQCKAGNKSNGSLACTKAYNFTSSFNCKKNFFNPQSMISGDVKFKIHKKKKLFDHLQNNMGSLSKCNGSVYIGTLSASKFINVVHSAYQKKTSVSQYNPFFHKQKILSYFYSFQAFW